MRRIRFALVLLGSLASPGAAQGFKLNGPLARPAAGDVASYQVSPDGTRVVYAADETDGVHELFVVRPSGGPRRRLSGTLVAGGDVDGSFRISPDGRWVVFVADRLVDERRELFARDLDGLGPVLALSAPFSTEGDVFGSFAISPDSARVVYLADPRGSVELFGVNIDGSAVPEVLSGPLAPVGAVLGGFRIDSGSTRVVYRAQRGAPGAVEIHSALLDGSAPPVRLNDPLAPGENVERPPTSDADDIVLAPDGTRVLFTVRSAPQSFRLYSAPIDGSAPPIAPVSGRVRHFAFLPDSSRVLYTIEETPLFGPDIQHLFSVSPQGGSRIELSAPAPNGLYPTHDGPDFAISPDGTRVVFRAKVGLSIFLVSRPVSGGPGGAVLDAALEVQAFAFAGGGTSIVYDGFAQAGFDEHLEVVPVDGSMAPLFLADTHILRPFGPLVVTPDGQRVLVTGDLLGSGTPELFSVAMNGLALPERLCGPLRSDRSVPDYRATPDGLGALYLADERENETFELFAAPVAGGFPARALNPPFPSGPIVGDVAEVSVAGDARVAYVADEDTDGALELFTAEVDRRAPVHGAVKVHPAFDSNTSIALHARAGDRLVYTADAEVDGLFELYSAPLDGSSPPVRLSGALIAPGVTRLEVSPDQRRVLYLGAWNELAAPRLFSVPVDGSTLPAPVSAALPQERALVDYALSPDSRLVAYLADEDALGVVELYVAPANGSALGVKRNGALVAGGDVQDFRFAPQHARLVYRADQELDNAVELYSVPLDGSLPPLKLNPPLPVGGDVSPFYAVARGRVVYRADQEVDGVDELYSQRDDGAASPPLELSGALVAGGDVLGFEVDADGERVVFKADKDVDGRFELYSARADSSSFTVLVSGTLVAGGDVGEFTIAPIVRRVLYLADAETNGRVELFAAPLLGGAPPVKLSGDVPPDTDGLSFRIARDGTRAVYVATLGERVGLFWVPCDASAPPRRVDAPLPPARSLRVFEILPDAEHVAYIAEREGAGVFELYSALLPRPGAPAPDPALTRDLLR